VSIAGGDWINEMYGQSKRRTSDGLSPSSHFSGCEEALVNGRLDRVCCMLYGKSICWRSGFADLWCGLLCGVGARANEREQTTRAIHQPSKPDARVPSTTQVPQMPMHQLENIVTHPQWRLSIPA
jgi:hypothetical protein